MMKAVRLHAIGDLRCDEVPIPEPRGTELLVRVGACGICGSDLPRVFEHGTSSGKYPLTIGHEFAGEIVAVGDRADPSLIGKRGAVFPLIPCRSCDPCTQGNFAQCEHYDYLGSRSDGGFAEYCLIPSAWHLIISNGPATLESLALTEPACVAQHAIRQADVTAGSFVVIFGAGPIGLLAAQWAQIFGAEPLLVDISPEKIEFAKKKGFSAVNSAEENICEAVLKYNGGKLADAAVEGTGVGSVISDCIQCVRPHGTVALLGNPVGDAILPFGIHSMALRKELTVRGVWNSSRSPWPVDEWQCTVEMINAGSLITEDLITDRIPLEELPGAIEDIRAGRRKIVKAVSV